MEKKVEKKQQHLYRHRINEWMRSEMNFMYGMSAWMDFQWSRIRNSPIVNRISTVSIQSLKSASKMNANILTRNEYVFRWKCAVHQWSKSSQADLNKWNRWCIKIKLSTLSHSIYRSFGTRTISFIKNHSKMMRTMMQKKKQHNTSIGQYHWMRPVTYIFCYNSLHSIVSFVCHWCT